MKFRGLIAESAYIRKFYQLIATVSKIGKTCILRLTEGKIFICLLSVVDPDLGFGVFFPLDPEWEKIRTWEPGSEKKFPDHISKSFLTVFLG
jgi:hypothetical protein